MAKEVELTSEQALERALKSLSDPVLSQLGIILSDPEEAGTRIAVGLAGAGSVESLLSEGEAQSWEDHEGESFLITRADFLPSTKPGTLGIYAVVTAVDVNTGELTVLTTGATNVVIQVAKMLKEGWTERPVKLKIKTAASGNPVHRLIAGDPGDTVPFD